MVVCVAADRKFKSSIEILNSSCNIKIYQFPTRFNWKIAAIFLFTKRLFYGNMISLLIFRISFIGLMSVLAVGITIHQQ